MGEDLIRKLEEDRKYLLSYSKKIGITTGLIIFVGVLLIFLGLTESTLLILGFVTIIIGVVVGSVMAMNSKYRNTKKQMKIDLVNWYLSDKGYENYNYNPNACLDWKIFYNQGLVTERPDIFKGEDLICGEYKNVKFQMSDITLQREERYTDSKGNTRTTIVTYFKGKGIIIDYPKNIDADCKLLDKTDYMFASKENKLETEVIEFNKKFHIYTSDKVKVFKILSPHMIQKILEFKKLQRGKVSLSFTYDKLYIVVNNNSDLAEIKLNKELTKENIGKYLGELLIPAAIVNEFRFDSHMYQNEE